MIATLLAQAGRAERGTLRAAIACAGLAAFGGTALLAVAGWFLTSAAIAGAGGVATVQAFNYLMPSAAIRALAILRTVARYAERLLGHRAALLTLANLRSALFARLATAPPQRTARRGAGQLRRCWRGSR